MDSHAGAFSKFLLLVLIPQPERAQSGPLLGSNNDQVRQVAIVGIVLVDELVLGGLNVVDEHRHIKAVFLLGVHEVGRGDLVLGVFGHLEHARAAGGKL